MASSAQPKDDPRHVLVAAFVDLIDAHFRTADHRAAARALDRLESLGVSVKLSKPRPRRRDPGGRDGK